MSVAPREATATRLPLAGTRIIDLTMAWAGPLAVRCLADLGAEVIKIEWADHMDRWRGGTLAQRGTERYPEHTPGDRPWNRSSYFHTQNRNKKSLILNLKADEGKAIFKRLVAAADAVAENFSAGAMARLNLDYPVLREIRPDLVMLSMPAFGRTGPDRDYIGHGPTLEEVAGTAYLQGYPDGSPLPSGGMAWGDPISGITGAVALLTALVHRTRTGQGQHIDLSHMEAGIELNFWAILEYTMNGRIPPRQGNRDASMVPHGVYPCRGEDRWIAIAIRSDAEWARLRALIGEPDWAADPALETLLGRLQARETVDARLAAWTSDQDAQPLMERLQAAGLAAGTVHDAAGLAHDPHLAARGFFESVTCPETGTYPYPGMPWKLSRTPASIRMPAPRFGEHNAEVLCGLLGLSQEEVEDLETRGIVASQPYPQGD